MKDTAIVILAAGNSSRFGSSKQLVRLNNKTLIQHVIDEAVGSAATPVIVVIGANADIIAQGINKSQVQIVLNESWKSGMAGSIATGVNAAIASGKIKNIILTVSDQPFVSTSLFNRLYQVKKEGTKSIVASSYADTIGTPALFTQKYFDGLLSLNGEDGAKKILQNNREDVATIDFPQGEIDIDTQMDYQNLLRDKNSLEDFAT